MSPRAWPTRKSPAAWAQPAGPSAVWSFIVLFSELRLRGVGVVAAANLQRNSILQDGMLVSPPQLKAGEREVAILVDASTGVAGKVQSGSRVDIIAGYQGDEQKKQQNRSIVVVAGALVLDVGQPRLKSGGGVQQSDQPTDPTQVVMSVERARLAMQLASQIRTKAVESYNDIFHTQV